MVGIADALADLLIKFCDLGQKRFTGKVRNICNADKYIGEKAGGKDGKGSSCQLFIDNIQNFVSKGISVFVIDVMKIFYVCGDQGDGEGTSGTFLDLPDLFRKGFRRDGRDYRIAGMGGRGKFPDSSNFPAGFVLLHFFVCGIDQIFHHKIVILETDFISDGIT